jgi:peptidoglycan hydrolase-like protein with peptidoglycan-binding domain
MSTNDDFVRSREPWELAHECESAIRRARRRRSIADRLRTRARRVRSARGSFVTITALLAIAAPLSLASGGGMLQRGSSGVAVKALQRALGVTPTGNFGPVTARAVRAFQRSHGLGVDGIVGPQTSGALGIGGGSATPAGGASSRSSAGRGSSATLARIAQCESGGDPTAVSAGGRYRGKYQFSRATWRAMGGSGDPARASEAEQDQRAAALFAQAGASPWPVCG